LTPWPDRAEALEGVAQPILQKFWDPRMRREFLALVDAQAPGVSAVVLDAVAAHRALLAPKAG
jgi:formate dehydrogenase subunit delta